MPTQLTPTRQAQWIAGDLWSRAVRTVVVLLLGILAMTPVTQHIGKSDDFLHGQDTETTLILGLTVVSLSLLRMERLKAAIDEAVVRLKECLSSFFDLRMIFRPKSCQSMSALFPARSSRGKPRNETGLPLLI